MILLGSGICQRTPHQPISLAALNWFKVVTLINGRHANLSDLLYLTDTE